MLKDADVYMFFFLLLIFHCLSACVRLFACLLAGLFLSCCCCCCCCWFRVGVVDVAVAEAVAVSVATAIAAAAVAAALVLAVRLARHDHIVDRWCMGKPYKPFRRASEAALLYLHSPTQPLRERDSEPVEGCR